MAEVDCTLTECKSCGYFTKTWIAEGKECYRCGASKTSEETK